jgi:hypothetical protein
MAVMIPYVIEDLVRGDRMRILTEFRSNDRAHRLLELGAREREARFPTVDDSGSWARRAALVSALSLGVR